MSLISVEQKDSIIRRINNVDTCSDLKEIKTEIDEFTQSVIQTATDKLQELTPLLSLLEVPTSPDEVVDWVKSFIENYLTKTLSPALKLQIEIPVTVAYIVEIGDAFIDKASEIGSCTLDVVDGG